MNKIFPLFTLIMLPFFAWTQIIQDDFEGNGTITTWFGDDCGLNTQRANPFPQGINPSATVLEYDDQGGQYANVRFDVSQNLDLTVKNTFSIKIYVPSSSLTGSQPNQVSLKLQDGNLPEPWSTQSEIIKPIQLDRWQTVTFNFATDTYINLDPNSLPPLQRTDFNRVLIQVNGENNTDLVKAYIDDVVFLFTASNDPVYDRLVWSDECNGSGIIDTSKWFHQTQLPIQGSWFNGEIQHYTNRLDNAFLDDSVMKIVAKKENFTDQGVTKTHTSARLNSKFAFTYGRVEVRAKLPTGVGTWPAIWTLGKNIDEEGAYWQTRGFGTTGWPACGEIDIMEHWGDNQDYISSAMHTPSSFGGTVNVGGRVIPGVSTKFHVYALEWSPEKMVFSVDDVVHYTYNPPVKDANTWPFTEDQYILLNVAIEPEIDPNFTESALEIDYVRVYQEQYATGLARELKERPQLYPNPIEDELRIRLKTRHDAATATISISDLGGKLLRADIAPVRNNTVSMSELGDLPRGMYLVTCDLGAQIYHYRVLKN